MCSLTASSMVSHAARVGAMTMTRPAGAALTKAACSGAPRAWVLRVTRGASARRGPVGPPKLVARDPRSDGGRLLRRRRRRRLLWIDQIVHVDLRSVLRFFRIAEDDPSGGRTILDRGGAIGWRRLLRRGDVLEPDAAHALGRALFDGNRIPPTQRFRLLLR